MKWHANVFLIILIVVLVASIVFTLIIGSIDPVEAIDAGSEEEKSYRVVSTIGMIGDLVASIASQEAATTTIIGTGIDPHLYTPTRNDVIQLQQADIVFYLGLHLEGAMVTTLDTLRQQRPDTIIALGEALPQDSLLYQEQQAPDPHIWMDVALWAECSDIVAEYLSQFDPVHRADYQKRAQEYKARLLELDSYIHTITASIPKKNRSMITAHDAFAYFGRAYAIDVYGIQGVSTVSEASIERVNELVRFIADRQIPSIFAETSVPDRYVRALIEGSAALGHKLSIGGNLFSDAMGAAGSYRGTYIGMLDHNATLITRSLGGTADPGGFQNALH